MKADKKNWFCTTCSEGFTRRYGADRHIRNIHSGQAKRVRWVDYVIGRISGEFSAADPLAYRRRMQQSSNRSTNSYEHENLPSPTETSRVSSDIGMRKTTIEEAFGYLSPFNNMRSAARPTLSDQANGLNRETRKRDTVSFPKTWPRLEEAKNLLMSLSAHGEKPPLFIEQILVNLTSSILQRGGDDSFLEQPLKELRNKVNLISAAEVFGRLSNLGTTPNQTKSEHVMQEQAQFSVASVTSLPQDAVDDLAQIRDMLIPFHPPELVQNRLNELVTSYHQTGDSNIFKRALVYYLNRPTAVD